MSGAGTDRSVILRTAVAGDVPAIGECVAAAYQHYLARMGKPPGPMCEDYARVVEEHEVHVAVDGADLLGVLVLIHSGDGMLLDNVAVHPRAQGRGVGRALLELAEARTRAAGHHSLELYTHVCMTENLALYERIGYAETARRTVNGYDRVYMRKRLR